MKSLNDSLDECKQIDAESKWMPSFEKYLQRLATYELFKWFSKPAEFSPIECARRGWVNFSKDTLKCVACSRLFYFYTQSPTKKFAGTSNTSAKPANDANMLVEKHNEKCPWRTLTVPSHLIKVDVVDDGKAYRSFVKLRSSLLKCEKLPLLGLDTVENFSSLLDESEGAKLDSRDKMINIIASCGWNYKEDKNILSCDKCLRSIGLWLYKRESGNESKFWQSREDQSSSNDTTSNPTSLVDSEPKANLKNYPIKKRKLNEIESNNEQPAIELSSKENDSIMDKKKLFDPIGEHFAWCPWLDEKPDTVVLNFRSSTSVKRLRKSVTNQSICYANFQVINRHLHTQPVRKLAQSVSNIKSSSSLADLITRSVDESKSESQRLIERAKSIKSLLINCTAQAPN